MKRHLLVLTILALSAALGWAQAPPAAAKPAAVPITDSDLKSVDTPKPEVRAKGDPDGWLTGNVSDVSVGDSKKGLTIGDALNQIGQNKIAINFRLDADHRLSGDVHAGRLRHRRDGAVPREERQPHHDDELHGLRCRDAGLLADRFLDPDGRRRRGGEPRWHAAAERRVGHHAVRKAIRHVRPARSFPDARRAPTMSASW